MKDKRLVKRAMNKIYLTVGKIVVLTGAFLSVFYLLSVFFKFFEPILTQVSKVVLSNSHWVVISVFALTLILRGVLMLLHKNSKK